MPDRAVKEGDDAFEVIGNCRNNSPPHSTMMLSYRDKSCDMRSAFSRRIGRTSEGEIWEACIYYSAAQPVCVFNLSNGKNTVSVGAQFPNTAKIYAAISGFYRQL